LACIAVLALAGCANTAAAGSGANAAAGAGTSGKASGDTVKIMVGGLNKQIYLPFMLAKQLGYYAKAGVNVSLQDEGAGVDATTEMVAGQVEGTGGFYDHTIALQGSGKFAESVVSMLQVPGEVELCRTDLKGKINSPADWKGAHLGITDIGSSTDFLTQYLGKKSGVDPSQTHRIGVQAGATLIAAMQPCSHAAQEHRLRNDDRADGVQGPCGQDGIHSGGHAHGRRGQEVTRRYLPRDFSLHANRLRHCT
jgi:NitT/TauT family transport system substrate-binding protein